jgi:hypothetical protein
LNTDRRENTCFSYAFLYENQSKLIPSPSLFPKTQIDLNENSRFKKYFKLFFIITYRNCVYIYLNSVYVCHTFSTIKQGVSCVLAVLFFSESFCKPKIHLKLASRQDMKNTYYGRCSLKLKSLFLIVSKLFWKRGFFFCLGLR